MTRKEKNITQLQSQKYGAQCETACFQFLAHREQ